MQRKDFAKVGFINKPFTIHWHLLFIDILLVNTYHGVCAINHGVSTVNLSKCVT
jgi:hypothetical protein